MHRRTAIDMWVYGQMGAWIDQVDVDTEREREREREKEKERWGGREMVCLYTFPYSCIYVCTCVPD
jgi:hypothetical protein